MSLRLIHVGFLIVGIPLVFELTLLATMNNLVNDTQASLQKTLHSRNLLVVVSRLICDYIDIVVLLGEGASGNLNPDKLELSFARIRSDIDDFERLANTPTERAKARETKDACDAISQFISPILKLYRDGEMAQILLLYRQHKKTFVQLNSGAWTSGLMSFSESTREANRLELERQLKLNEQERQLAYIGIFLSILISVSSSLVFTRNISSKLQTMVKNCSRFKNGEPLLKEQQQGLNELSQLDRKFHDLAARLDVAREQLKEANNLRCELLSVLTEEINQPLKSVISALESMQSLDLSERDRKLLEIAKRNATIMMRLADDLVDLDKLQTSDIELNRVTVDLSALVDVIMDNLTAFAETKQIKMQRRGEANCWADINRLEQVIMNLLVNAIKYSPKGGTITVDIKTENDETLIAFIDEGRGIPPAKLKQIFEPFKQAEDLEAPHTGGMGSGGVGLGLAVCAGLVKLHGGSIRAESDGVSGSTFTVCIPNSSKTTVASADHVR